MAEAKDTYYWRALFRDGTKLDQYQYEAIPKGQRKDMSLFPGLTAKLEMVATRPGYPSFGIDIPKEAAPQFMLFWKSIPGAKPINKDGEIPAELVYAIGFSIGDTCYMQGVELESRNIIRWKCPKPRKNRPKIDVQEMIKKVG